MACTILARAPSCAGAGGGAGIGGARGDGHGQAAQRHLDAELRVSRDAGPLRPGRRHQGRPAERPQRPGPGAGHLRRRRLLRAPGEMDRLARARMAGVVGRAAREPARGPVGAQRRQGGQGVGDAVVRLLPRLPRRSRRSPTTSDRCRTRSLPFATPVGNERRRAGPAHGHRDGRPARRQGRPRWPLARRIGGHRVRDVELRRPAGRRRPGGPRLRRRRQHRRPRQPRRWPARTCWGSPTAPRGFPSAVSRRQTWVCSRPWARRPP